tara:strand:+ start:248 stop:454 length:207 start_codon:yes stop_codon:yes gene_type:complete
MAVIPITPQRKINQRDSGVVTGIRETKAYPNNPPKRIKRRFFGELGFSKVLPTIKIEAQIRPKKSPQV